jgi:hypothetical protein
MSFPRYPFAREYGTTSILQQPAAKLVPKPAALMQSVEPYGFEILPQPVAQFRRAVIVTQLVAQLWCFQILPQLVAKLNGTTIIRSGTSKNPVSVFTIPRPSFAGAFCAYASAEITAMNANINIRLIAFFIFPFSISHFSGP